MTERLHRLLYLYNVGVVLLISIFMCVTQEKIVRSMSARSFLENAPALPLPSPEGLLASLASLALLALSGWFYRRKEAWAEQMRYLGFFLEIGACVLVMRSVNLAYDGVVLLMVADLLHRYEGRHQEYLLLFSMLGLYFIANYNLAVFQMSVMPFESYLSYYNTEAQAALSAVRNTFVSLNIMLFVLYLVFLVRSKNDEKERIRRLNEQLGEANAQLRRYASEAAHMAETRERNRLAREIHDTLGHALTGIAAGLDACILTVDAAPDFTKQQLAKIRETAKRGITDVRRSVKKLRPADLEELPLREAIVRMTEEFAASSGMNIQLTVALWPEKLRRDQEEVIYRIVQEGITNANRHGRAKNVTITFGGDAAELVIIIADDGSGCAEVKPGFGLRHMRERLDLLHGKLNCWSDGGFIIEASLPLNRDSQEETS